MSTARRRGTAVDGVTVTAPVSSATAQTVRIGSTVLRLVADAGALAKHGVVDEGGYFLGPGHQRLYEMVRLVAREDGEVLLLGETGVGKERLAEAFHLAGRRAHGPYVSVNCASLPRDIADSLLFGAIKGAFSGATESRDGHFARAHRGVLFLDEVSELEPDVQAKLLRAVEAKEIQAVGSPVIRKVDVRVLAATQPTLLEDVEGGHFRRDLYARLATHEVRIPPLRERREEIAFIIRAVLGDMEIAARAVEACLRGLAAQRPRAAQRAELGGQAGAGGRRVGDRLRGSRAGHTGSDDGERAARAEALSESVEGMKREAIVQALREAGGMGAAARRLKIGRTTLYEAIKKYGTRDDEWKR